MASPGQKKGACGHIMASFDKHSRCARCREKGHGDDPCVQNLQCDFCSVLTPEQVLKLSTPTYKLDIKKIHIFPFTSYYLPWQKSALSKCSCYCLYLVSLSLE